jgi:IS30 family transposase
MDSLHNQIQDLQAQGKSIRQMASELGISKSTVGRMVKEVTQPRFSKDIVAKSWL